MRSYRLTQHAQQMIEEREIPVPALESVLEAPDLVRNDKSDASLRNLYKVLSDDASGRVLKAVVREEAETVIVITAYFDRSMRGKI